MKCRACESSNRPGARFCHRCSTPLPPSCIGCGAPLSAAGELCPACRTERLPQPLADELFDEGASSPGTDPATYSFRPTYTGRASVLETLEEAYREAVREGELRFVLLVGEPGLGKSRTLKELVRRIRDESPEARVLVGASERGKIKYGPFARVLASRFGIAASDPPDEARDKVIAGVGAVLAASRVTEVAHLLAHLMGTPFPDSPVVGPLAESPRRLEGRTFIALRRFLAADAGAQPLVICLENLELCGAETVNLLHYLAAGLRDAPILVACSARPSLFDRHPSFGEGDVALERIELASLDEKEAVELWRALIEPVADPPEELERHAARLGGSPRAIVELAHFLVEAGAIARDGEKWVIDRAVLDDLELPERHDELVSQRVAIMDEGERDILEKAAVVGQTFWLDAVVALVRVDGLSSNDPDGPPLADIAAAGDDARKQVAAVLARLAEREWLAPSPVSSVAGEREYRFSYPHLWTSVYEGLSDERRRRYHKLVAQWLELRPDGRSAVSLEAVAAHLELAGDPQRAAFRYRRAAEWFRRHYESEEAVRLYARALSCLGEADLAARMHLWHDLGSVYELVGDYEAALGCFERMLRLSWVCASRTKAAVAFNKMGRVWRRKGDLKLALEYLDRGRELFGQAGDPRGIAGSLDDIGNVLYLLGRYDDAFEKVTAALSRRGAGGDKRSIAHSLSNLGNIQKDRGRVAEAQNCHSEALALRREIGDRVGVIESLNNLAVLSFDRGEPDAARRGWEQALHEAEHIGALPLQAVALSNLGELALSLDHAEEARHRLEEARQLAEDIDDRRLQIEATRNLALLEHRGGDSVRARELAHHAHEIAAASGLREFEGRSLLTLGEIFGGALFDPDRTDEFVSEGPGSKTMPSAESFFSRGVALLRKIGNDSELAKGLERFGLYKIERGDVAAGRRMLEEALDIFRRLGMTRSREVEKVLSAV